MRKSDATFLLSVLGVAAAVSLMSLSEAARLLPGKSGGAIAVQSSAGTAREVDMDRLLELLRGQNLSSHEAEFYTKLPRASTSVSKPSLTGSEEGNRTPESHASRP